MLSIMETGQALYVLAGIAGMGVFTRLLTKNLYKRLMKESTNLAAAKNKSLKELRQRAENSYHVNQGMRDTGSWVEHQLNELHFRGMTLAGWSNLSTQLTWLCLLMGGIGAFYAYWYRMDTYYIVLYGGGSILMAMATMLFDGSIAAAKKDQLIVALQDYLENTMFPRLGRLSDRNSNERQRIRERSMDGMGEAGRAVAVADDNILSGVMSGSVMSGSVMSGGAMSGGTMSGGTIPGGAMSGGTMPGGTISGGVMSGSAISGGTISGGMMPGGPITGGTMSAGMVSGNAAPGSTVSGGMRSGDTAPNGAVSGRVMQGTDNLKRGLEQIAASRERSGLYGSGASSASSPSGVSVPTAEALMKELSPQDLRVINDVLKQYLN